MNKIQNISTRSIFTNFNCWFLQNLDTANGKPDDAISLPLTTPYSNSTSPPEQLPLLTKDWRTCGKYFFWHYQPNILSQISAFKLKAIIVNICTSEKGTLLAMGSVNYDA
jgi:hypothetical protein